MLKLHNTLTQISTSTYPSQTTHNFNCFLNVLARYQTISSIFFSWFSVFLISYKQKIIEVSDEKLFFSCGQIKMKDKKIIVLLISELLTGGINERRNVFWEIFNCDGKAINRSEYQVAIWNCFVAVERVFQQFYLISSSTRWPASAFDINYLLYNTFLRHFSIKDQTIYFNNKFVWKLIKAFHLFNFTSLYAIVVKTEK